jgi:hypothetical protein
MHQHKKWWLTAVAIAALVLYGAGTGVADSAAPLAATPGCGKAPTLRSGTHTI